MWGKNKENKIEKALEQLMSTIIINTIEYPDATTRKKGAKYICSLNKEDLTLPILKRILKYLKESTAFYSADLLEDDYYLDFKLMKANLSIDYKGGYTFVEDKWLPKYLVKERINYKKVLLFYMQASIDNKKLKKKYKSIQMPKMLFSDSYFYKWEFFNTIFYDSVFEHCEIDNVWFYKCNIEQSLFESCTFEGVQFTDTLLTGAKFINCTFNNCSFSELTLNTVIFNNCEFVEVKFFICELSKVDLSTCKFTGCYLSIADISQQDSLKQEELNTFLGDDKVIIPPHLERPIFWPKKSDIFTWDQWLEDGSIVAGKGIVEYE